MLAGLLDVGQRQRRRREPAPGVTTWLMKQCGGAKLRARSGCWPRSLDRRRTRDTPVAVSLHQPRQLPDQPHVVAARRLQQAAPRPAMPERVGEPTRLPGGSCGSIAMAIWLADATPSASTWWTLWMIAMRSSASLRRHTSPTADDCDPAACWRSRRSADPVRDAHRGRAPGLGERDSRSRCRRSPPTSDDAASSGCRRADSEAAPSPCSRGYATRRNSSKLYPPSTSDTSSTPIFSVCMWISGVSVYSINASTPLSRLMSHPVRQRPLCPHCTPCACPPRALRSTFNPRRDTSRRFCKAKERAA